MQSIENQVKKIRTHRKKRQGDMALVLEISQGAYSQRENGYVKFTGEELIKLARELDVTVETFYTGQMPEMQVVAEAEAKYERVDLSPAAINSRFLLVMRRYMADNGIRTIVEMSEKMRVENVHLTSISSGHKNVSMAILAKAVRECHFNANHILSSKGDYFILKAEMKGMISELTANYERVLVDKDKLIRSYEALLKSNGIQI